uniref:Uncharacterized protein n=1 Tax=Setaria italica TaxID=4555 RepID=K3Y3Z1_SETIT
MPRCCYLFLYDFPTSFTSMLQTETPIYSIIFIKGKTR